MKAFCTGCGAAFDENDNFCAKCGSPRQTVTRDAGSAARPGSTAAIPSAPTVQNAPGKPKGKIKKALVTGAALWVAIGLITILGGTCGGTEGSVAVSGGPRGAFTLTPTGCSSMQPYGRFGANLHGDEPNDGALYVTVDHFRGKSIEIEVPGSCRSADGTDCTVFSVPRDRCSVYDAEVDFSGVTVNDVRLVEGRVRLECTLEDGTAVRGAIEFDNC